MSELVTPSYVDRRLFSLHEEEDVVEITPDRRQVSYLETNLQQQLAEAEQRALSEQRLRQEAEQRAAAEAEARRQAEERAAALVAELERLRRGTGGSVG